MQKTLNIAMIGCGFMGKMHSNAYSKVNSIFDLDYTACMKVACDSRDNGKVVKDFASRWHWQEMETDWRRLLDRKDIDLIDICVPNSLHREIAVASLAAGKIVCTEKPLALNAEQGAQMVEAAEKSGKKTMIWFNQRRFPSITLAKQMIDDGALGRVFHYRGTYLQDWTISKEAPFGGPTFWRLDLKDAGSGVTGDLLAHALDVAMWLNGPVVDLSAMTETFIKERKTQADSSKVVKVEIDDAAQCMVRFANGSIGTFEASRYARGRKNANAFEINGEFGSFAFDAETPDQLKFYNHKDDSKIRGWKVISVWDSDQPYMDRWWVPGMGISYEHTFVHAAADFLADLADGKKRVPDFSDGLRTQMVCDTILASAKKGQWMRTGLT
ncbi:MAG: Gfo/Idh/MocA family oxidoreductase [Spirochaetia bacterium]